MLARDTEDENNLDLQALRSDFSKEGRKYFGPDYTFHDIDRDDYLDAKLYEHKSTDQRQKSEKCNKSETRLTGNNSFIPNTGLNVVRSLTPYTSNDFTSLTDVASNKSRKKKGGKKKTKMYEKKIADLNKQIEELKQIISTKQKHRDTFRYNSPVKTARGRTTTGKYGKVYTEKPYGPGRSPAGAAPEQRFRPKWSVNEDLLQYLYCTARALEEREIKKFHKPSP